MSWTDTLLAHTNLLQRAPSAHNTQPWVPQVDPDGITIGVDPARSLPHSDPGRRDLDLSLGAYVETCLIVAAGLGLPVTAAPGPRLVAAASPYRTAFTGADVERRRVARGPYEPGPIDPAVHATLEPGLVPVPTRELAADLAVADRWMFGTPAVATELRDWLRLDPRDPRYRRDGLTDRALELSRAEAVGLRAALAAYPVTRRLGLARALAAGSRGLLRYDGTVLVLTARPGEDGDRVTAGRRLLRTWLALGRHGLSVHPLSQLLDCPETAARLAARAGAEPLAVFRVGRPLTTPVRSARLASDLTMPA